MRDAIHTWHTITIYVYSCFLCHSSFPFSSFCSFFPRLTEEYRIPIESIAAPSTEPNQSETDRDSTMMELQPYQPRTRTRRRHRAFKPKHCMPYTIAIGEESQYHSFNATSRSHTLTPTTSVHDWYQCGSSIKFVRDLVIL